VGALTGLARTLDRGVTASTFLAAGLLRLDTLGRHMTDNWHQFGLQQSEADLAAGLFEWEKDFYGRLLRPADRLLLVGCGTGRDLVPLLARGHPVTAMEPVPACAEAARARVARQGLSAEVLAADITACCPPGPFDVVIFSWLCYSYIPLRARRLAVLRRVRQRLSPGGRVLISYALASPPPRRLPWRLARLTAQLSRSDWRPEYGDTFLARHDTGRIHFEHRFGPAEIEAEAGEAGFVVTFHEHTSDGNLALCPATA
jgi:SAM-dependent methyltransferase